MKKMLQLVGLLALVLSLSLAPAQTANATDYVTCTLTCSGVPYYAQCYSTLNDCCSWLPGMCPDGYEYQGGGCYYGQQYC